MTNDPVCPRCTAALGHLKALVDAPRGVVVSFAAECPFCLFKLRCKGVRTTVVTVAEDFVQGRLPNGIQR